MTSMSCKDKPTPGRSNDAVYLIDAVGSCHSCRPAGDEPWGSPALLCNLVESLGDALERIGVRGFGALRGFALDDKVGTTAHDFDHLRFFRSILHPGSIVLRVHRVCRSADRGRSVVTCLLRIAYDHRHLVLHSFRRSG